MTETQPEAQGWLPSGGPAHYEIRVADVLDSRWAVWFDGLHIDGQGEETVISGLLADQPALHGLLTRIGDLGLCLMSVRRMDTDGGPSTTGSDPEAPPARCDRPFPSVPG